MKRISKGNYEGEFRGVKFSIHKVEQINTATKNKWYWLIYGKGGDDWFNSKAIAIEAAKEIIITRFNR